VNNFAATFLNFNLTSVGFPCPSCSSKKIAATFFSFLNFFFLLQLEKPKKAAQLRNAVPLSIPKITGVFKFLTK
jgi:hypothetical protein